MKKEIGSILKNYFSFNHQEKVMVWVFMVLIISLVGVFIIIDKTNFNSENPAKSNYALADSLLQLMESQNQTESFNNWKIDSLFVFDPNKIDKDGLVKLGFNSKVADRLLKYRAKVPFRQANDLKKLYGIDKSLIDTLAPYMVFEKTSKPQYKSPYTNSEYKNKFKQWSEEKEETLVYINSASVVELTLLKGIGPTLSKRIESYREKLGGFVSEWQLLEVYGIDSSVILNNKSIVYIDSDNIRKININTVDWKELVAHPYVDGKTATLIINYRQQHGNYNSMEDLAKIKIISKEFWGKISEYIDFAE